VDSFLFDGEYLLVGEDGSVVRPNGKPVVQHVWGRFWVSNHAHVLKPKGEWSISALRQLLNVIDIGPFVTGAVQPKLSMTNLKRVPVVIPDPAILSAYAREVQELLVRERLNTETISTLAELRDTLLPRLISGKLRVPEAEDLVEAVL
jgi:type I restriction enzyme S subunit